MVRRGDSAITPSRILPAGAMEASRRRLLQDVRSGQLESACKALDQQWAASGATYLRSNDILVKHKISLFRGATYHRIRFLRWLFKAEGMSVQMDAEELEFVKCMGAGTEKGYDVAGVESFDDAQAACAELRKLPAASGANFDLDDLICWLCLSTHKEAQAGVNLPAPAEPVSVDADLGLTLTSQGERRKLRRKVLHLQNAASGAPQGQAAGAQEAPHPLGQGAPHPPEAPSVAPPTRTFALAAVLPGLVRWLPVADAGSLCQTCQRLHADGVFGPRPQDATRARVADTVANALSLQGPLATALLQAGLSSAAVFSPAEDANCWRWPPPKAGRGSRKRHTSAQQQSSVTTDSSTTRL